MAIVFIQPLQANKLRMAFNNDIIRFKSDNVLAVSYAEVTASGLAVRLYPNPANEFFINMKSYVAALINTRNFEDTLKTNLPESYIYDYSTGSVLNLNMDIKIVYSDATSEHQAFGLTWLAGVEQLDNNSSFTKSDNLILSPFKAYTNNYHYLKYWQGYPFDVSFYSNGTLQLINQTNLLEAEFTIPGQVSRLFFSDGRVDETIEDIMPLAESFNEFRAVTKYMALETDRFLTIEKIPYKCGVYMKWLNKFGGYSYWLFEDTYSIDRNSKSLGELDRDNGNIETSLSRTLQVGQQSQDTIRVITERLNIDEKIIVEGILESPKIYLFTGQPFARNDYNDWLEVSLKTTNARVKNFKQELTNFVLDFELPVRYTQTL